MQTIPLTCNKLGVRFGGVRAVEDVDLELRSGEMLAIIGANGREKPRCCAPSWDRDDGRQPIVSGESNL
jgi:ABC-type uncharacterized transport system ATPase subunit